MWGGFLSRAFSCGGWLSGYLLPWPFAGQGPQKAGLCLCWALCLAGKQCWTCELMGFFDLRSEWDWTLGCWHLQTLLSLAFCRAGEVGAGLCLCWVVIPGRETVLDL